MGSENDNKELFAMRDGWYERARKQTLETLPDFLSELADLPHDYNTSVYATGAAAVAAAWAMNGVVGLTGFQAGGVMWEFMERWNHVKAPARLQKGEDILYPQHAERFTSISPDWMKWAQEEAAKLLAERNEFPIHPDVKAHWESIAAGTVPFGLSLAA